MIVDTSVLVAILMRESHHMQYLPIMESTEDVKFSAATLVETIVVMHGRIGTKARDYVRTLLADTQCCTVPFT